MSMIFKPYGASEKDPGQPVVVLRVASPNDSGYTSNQQLFVRFGDGGERVVDRECLFGNDDLPPAPEPPAKPEAPPPPPPSHASARNYPPHRRASAPATPDDPDWNGPKVQ